MARKTDKKNNKKGPTKPVAASSVDPAQDSEYLNLRKRVDARQDAKEILKIAKKIENEP